MSNEKQHRKPLILKLIVIFSSFFRATTRTNATECLD